LLEPLEDRLAPAVFNVNSTADILNPPAGVVTLRFAIQTANAVPGGNTINLTVPGTYRITLPPPAGVENNSGGDFDILPGGGDLNIINTSGGAVTVDGNHLGRVFDINPTFDPANPTPKFMVTMQGFTITNGAASPGDAAAGSGGGIRDQGNASLTLTNMVITNNAATADGGGVAMENTVSEPWTLTLNNTTVTNNHAGDAGGGLETDGSGKIFINSGTTVTGDTCVNQGAGIWLDAIQVGNDFQGANLTMTGTVVSDNDALTGPGGGIGNAGNGNVTITNSTLQNNVSGTSGGGFGDENAQGTFTISNSIVSNNTAMGNGGGIAAGGATTTITNALLQANAAGGAGGAVFANGVTLFVQASTLAGNTSVGNGGGIELETTGAGLDASLILNTTITGNLALNNAGANGGGIDAADAFAGDVILLNDTINANFAAVGGGVFWAATAASSFVVQNTIIAGNSAAAGPDAAETALFLASLSGAQQVPPTNSTGTGFIALVLSPDQTTISVGGGVSGLTGNITAAHLHNAPAGANGPVATDVNGNNIDYTDGQGGTSAIFPTQSFTVNAAFVAQLMVNNIYTNIHTTAFPTGEVRGQFSLLSSFTDRGGNLIGVSGYGGGNIGFTAASTQTGTVASPLDPLLAPLANNGGPSVGAPGTAVTLLTEALYQGSPAVGAGLLSRAPANDERGMPHLANAVINVGAVSAVVTPPVPVTKTISSLISTSGGTTTYNVNSTADLLNPPPGILTLRAALQLANAATGNKVINLAVPGDYKITLPGTAGEIDNAAGEFAIVPSGGNVSIINTSGGTVTVDGNHLARVFDIDPNFDPANPPPAFTVTMQGFTITNGIASPGDAAPGSGGGIRDQGNASLTLTNMVVTGNIATADGGGLVMDNIVNSSWTLAVNNSTISDNHAGDAGGGIDTDGNGQVVITNTTITGNTDLNQGAGIYVDAIQVGAVFLGGSMTMNGTLVSNNQALAAGVTGSGGGISNAGNGTISIVNSTVSNNVSGGAGGGFSDENNQGTLNIWNSVFLNNTALENGGGIQEGGPSTTITNTLIQGNAAGSGGGVFANGTTLFVQTSTLADNVSGANGGGVELDTTGIGLAASTLTNSTLTGNLALNNTGVNGGGIDAANTGDVVLKSDTINANLAATGGGISWTEVPGSTFNVQNTIIAQNAVLGGIGPDAAVGALFVATLNGAQQVPPTVTPGTGTASILLSPDQTIITVNSVWTDLIGIPTAAHLHDAPAGENGPVATDANGNNIEFAGVPPTTTGAIPQQTFVVNAAFVSQLFQGSIYENIHTTAFPAGEIRGQFSLAAGGFTDLGGNLIGVSGPGSGNSGFTAASTQTGTIANPLNPLLGALANNGGPTMGAPGATQTLTTESLLIGSPAAGTGLLLGALPTDERGAPSLVNGLVSIGAFSATPATTAPVTGTTTVINVNSAADILNPPAGVVTLRSAIQAANNMSGAKTIKLTVAGTYKITLAPTGADDNSSGDFDILPSNGNLTIINTSGGAVTVDGNHLDRVFDVNPNDDVNVSDKFTVTMQGFTIANGIASPGDGATGSGGGVRDQGIAGLTLTNMVVTNNTATADGGGISMENAASAPWTLTVNNSTISNNHAGDAGGGIDTDGSGKVFINTGTVISGNVCVNQGAGIWLDAIQVGNVFASADLSVNGAVVSNNNALTGPGGGIGNAGNGAVNITNTTIQNNTSGANGGGFGDQNAQGTLAVWNSIISNNTSALSGGGIAAGGPATTISNTLIQVNASGLSGAGVFANGATLTVQSSTITGNTSGGNGAGIELETTGAGLLGSTITDSTISGNQAVNNAGTQGGGIDAAETFTGDLVLLNDTINGNFADVGGGVFWASTAGSNFVVQNTIIAANTASVTGPDIAANLLYTATLNGAQQVPPVPTTGAGNVSILLTPDLTTITISGSVSGLVGTVTAAHLHNAPAGVNGPVAQDANGNNIDYTDGLSGLSAGTVTPQTFTVNSGFVTQLQVGNIYTNVHTTAFPNGEIRGQFALADGAFTDRGGNVIGVLSAGTAGFGADTQTGSAATPLNPLRAPLANNGGPTIGASGTSTTLPTEALYTGSPAIGTGSLAEGPAYDERGSASLVNAHINAGAVSLVINAPTPPKNSNPSSLISTANGTTTYNVNSTADILNPPAGVLTLRRAIQLANAAAGNKIINLTVAGTYQITLVGTPGETDNAAGEFAILPSGGNLSIINASGGAVTVDANHLGRAFDINPNFDPNHSSTKYTVTMQGFTIANGIAAPGDAAGGSGGGIRDQGNASLTLTNMVLKNNIATADGGGVSMENSVSVPWTLTLNNTQVLNNHAGDAGGGVETDGSGTILVNSGSIISGNSCVNQGGGIWIDAIDVNNVFQGAVLAMTSAQVNSNQAFMLGGGIGNAGNGTVTITSSTLQYNFSALGGGFGDVNGQDKLSVVKSYMFRNAAIGDGGGIAATGPSTTITSSQLQGNVAGGTGGAVFAGGSTLAVLSSTLVNNVAALGGGGIELDTTGTGTARSSVTTSTITINSALNNANANGGAIDAGAAFSGSLLLLNDTVNANFAASGGGVYWAHAPGSAVSVQNTIIAQNFINQGGVGPDAAAATLYVATLNGAQQVPPVVTPATGTVDILLSPDQTQIIIMGSVAGLLGSVTAAHLHNAPAGANGPVAQDINGNNIDYTDGVAGQNAGTFTPQTFFVGAGFVSQLQAGNIYTNVHTTAFPTGEIRGQFAPVAGDFTDLGGNVIGVAGAGSGNTGFTKSTHVGSVANPLNPLLGILKNNGGPVVGSPGTAFNLQTEVPITGSPVINVGIVSGAPTTDERGAANVVNGKVNAGAVSNAAPPTSSASRFN